MFTRQLKKLILLALFLCFSYFFIQYGFSQKEPHSRLGEDLDKSHMKQSKLRKHINKHRQSEEIMGEEAIWDSILNRKTSESHDEMILRDFLAGKTVAVKQIPTKKIIGTARKEKPKKPKKKYKHTKKIRKNKNKKKKHNKNKRKGKNKVDNKKNEKLKHPKKTVMIPKEAENHKLNIQTGLNNPKIQKTEKESKNTEKSDKNQSKENRKPGGLGKAVTLPQHITDDIKKKIENGWKTYQFNEYVSSLISVDRTLKDFRSDYCIDYHQNYDKNLPPASVVIVFYNEAWSTLIRTIHSVINNTPSNLIKEILLVDDYSSMQHLKRDLDNYIQKMDKVRLIRNSQREGLIRSRNYGAAHAKGKYLVFLDSHVECTKGWLEPLIDRIHSNKTKISVPRIEPIHDDTFEMLPQDRTNSLPVGGFSWNMQFKWFYVKASEQEYPDAPIKTPTIAGGLFAIEKKYFEHVGMYDPGLNLWGGENLELSFKTWMCGGRIESVPCSHVGHVYRKKSPYEWPQGTFERNCLRVAKVWMDDYIDFYRLAAGSGNIKEEEIADRAFIRKSLNCKSFSWYLKNIYPERSIPMEQIAYGQIKSLGNKHGLCLDSKAEKYSPFVTAFNCDGKGGPQYWEYNGEIFRDNYCVTYNENELTTKHCRGTDKQRFDYDEHTSHLILKYNKKCLTVTKDHEIALETCQENNPNQKWELENFDRKRAEKFKKFKSKRDKKIK